MGGSLLGGNAAGTADDDKGREVADKHRQHILDAQRDGMLQGNASFELVRAGVGACLFLVLGRLPLSLISR